MRPTSSNNPTARYGAWARVRNLAILNVILLISAGAAMAETRLLAFGDSLVQGFGLPVEDGFVQQLRRWLEAHGETDVALINAGVSGDTATGGLDRVDWSVPDGTTGVILELADVGALAVDVCLVDVGDAVHLLSPFVDAFRSTLGRAPIARGSRARR